MFGGWFIVMIDWVGGGLIKCLLVFGLLLINKELGLGFIGRNGKDGWCTTHSVIKRRDNDATL